MALRLVLDTNVWLEWLVFDDPGISPLKAAVGAGEAEVFMAPACEQELERALGYALGKVTLDAGAQAARLAECRRTVRWLEGSSRLDAARLPVCRDPDDQKFLELARDCGADFLVTRDRALLIIARRENQLLPFRIITPQQFGQRTESD
jgi:putative PIN family toxin of toxin-antitoxin system